MAASVLVDAGFLLAILTDRDTNHNWANTASERYPPPWVTCEAALSEAFYLLRQHGAVSLIQLLDRGSVVCPFRLEHNTKEVISLLRKYASVAMSLADACLVRMSETMSQPVLLTTDSDFRIYRRHSRQAIPCLMPD